MPIAELSNRDRYLIVGSFLRKDHPLLAQRIRQAVKQGGKACVVHSADDDLLMPVANKAIVAPSEIVATLAQILVAVAAEKEATLSAELQKAVAGVVASEMSVAIAKSLVSGKQGAVLLGNFAQQHPQAAQIAVLAEQIATLCEAKFGYLGEAANSVGGYVAGAVPFNGSVHGMNAAGMIESGRKAYLLLNVEPELDMQNPQAAMRAMKAADMVVCLSAYKHNGMDYADVMLPIAPFTETSGTFINTEGRAQSFKGAVKPLGEARPAWKVLRVLGNLLDISGFDFETSEAVRDEALSIGSITDKLNNQMVAEIPLTPLIQNGEAGGLQRVADVPIYSADAVVRRASSLQQTQDAAIPVAMMAGCEMQKLGLNTGDRVKVTQGAGSAQLIAVTNDQVPPGAVRVAAGHPATAALGAMFGTINVERA